MTNDFTLVDFALMGVRPAKVAHALGDLAQGTEPSGKAQPKGRPGVWARASRLFAPRAAASGAARVLRVQPPGHLPPPPLARFMPDDLGYGAGETPFRITAPIGAADLTLIEFREGDGDVSVIAQSLARAFPGERVYYFRLSGTQHPGSDTAFHIYLDGRATRRAASISANGTNPEADWRVVDSGMPDTLEADSLPPIGARAWDVMTPERQGRILEAMGVEPDALFTPDLERTSVELSTAPGGLELHEVWQIFSAPTPTTTREQPVEPDRPAAEAAPVPASVSQHADRDTDAVETEAAGALSRPSAEGPDTDIPQDLNWDTEVTSILVTAVAHALPEDEQIPWLTHLTSQLEAGDVKTALSEARTLIEMGDRPAEERARDAQRLSELFGVDAS